MNTMLKCAGWRTSLAVGILLLVCSSQMIAGQVGTQQPGRVTALPAEANATPLRVSERAAVELVRAIERAYRGIQTCEIRQELQNRAPNTGKEQPVRWRECLLFDRKQASFRKDAWIGESSTPTVVTVCNGRQLWHRDWRPLYSSFVDKDGKEDHTDLNPRKVMELPVSRPLDFYSLVAQQHGLRGDWCPLLALLMGQELIPQLQWACSEPGPLQYQRLEPKPDDPLELVGLRVFGWEKVGRFCRLVFWIDPQRFWIMRTEWEDESGVVVQINKTTVHVTDRIFEAKAFEFDTAGLTVVNSERALNVPTGFKQPDSMVGKAVPALQLKTLNGEDYDLAKDVSAVVVLMFAKWDRVQFQLQPWIPKFHKWIQSTGKSVSFYAVSSGQSDEAIKRVWEEQGLSIPVLLDRDEAVREAFKVGMPQTFMIHRGKILQEGVTDYMCVVADVEAALSLENTNRGPQAKEESAPARMGKGLGDSGKGSVSTSMVGKSAPAIRLKTMDGNDYDLAKDPAAVVVLDFWTTWCGPCRQALPSLQKFHEWTQRSGKSVSLCAINCGQTDEVVRKLWKEKQLTIPVLMDKAGGVADAFNVVSLPKTFVVWKRKVVREDIATDFEALVAAVGSVLAER